MDEKKRAAALNDEELEAVSGGSDAAPAKGRRICPDCKTGRYLKEYSGGTVKCTKCGKMLGIE